MARTEEKGFLPGGDMKKKLISNRKIQAKLVLTAGEIDRDYAGREIVIICNLNGAFMVTADLVRLLRTPLRVDFIRYTSYKGAGSTGTVTGSMDLTEDISGKPVILVEDIIDTGLTVNKIREDLAGLHPSEMRVFSLLYRKGGMTPDYGCFEIEDGFVFGYGLDLDGSYRELRDIWRVLPKKKDN